MNMKTCLWILIIVAVSMMSCSRSARYHRSIAEAESIASTAPDSALAILSEIEVADLKTDSLKARYAIALASAHKAADASLASDSLTRFAAEYYRDVDYGKWLRAGELYALHRFWSGDGEGALQLLDSLTALTDSPDSLMTDLLVARIRIGGQQGDYSRNIPILRRLIEMDTNAESQSYYKHELYLNYTFVGKCDSAFILLNELIDDAKARNLDEQLFEYKYEMIGVLMEGGRYPEAIEATDYIIVNAPENSALPYLYFWKALGYLNMGDFAEAARLLDIADGLTGEMSGEEYKYYRSFAGHIRDILAFQNTGKISILQLAELSNTQRDRFFREEQTSHEAVQKALKAENRALVFKSQSERKTFIIAIVVLITLIVALVAVWLLQKHRRKAVEAEERAETLQMMVDELRKPAVPSGSQDALRRAMLQQLGIIKMVAETPTEQNRDMLRKISSISSDTNGSLVNWPNLYEIIDNLYGGFYTRLHCRYGDTLSEKEEQIIVLMAAGFSAKEISVITSQSTASIYVRKSSARKKLGVAEKGDLIEFLQQELSR